VSSFQLVCATQPRCLCIAPPNPDDECACRVPVAGARTCVDCQATLELRDATTGEIAGDA